MAKKARQRITYVLPLANSPGGHRLGVNGLAVDSRQSILYSGGRDGAICAWDLNLDLSGEPAPAQDPFEDPPSESSSSTTTTTTKTKTTFRAQAQAHTHWVNDIVLAQDQTALVSASSDLTVKVWRPQSEENLPPETVGQHSDYVKCLATPYASADWVASGGLDRKICLWDLNGAGKRLEIEAGDEEPSDKGSVYALSVGRSILASGGPESIVRVWDPRTGKRITKFVGHTDNVRAVLINEAGDAIMTASSDQTVKVWSVTAGRCMHTLTMHNDSVWSLFSDDPALGVFYSSDRSGLVVKTDVRGTLGDMDDGLSLAVAQEHEGVSRVVACGDYIWTATSSSSINRWGNVDTGADIQLPQAFRQQRNASVVSKPATGSPQAVGAGRKKEIPANSILRISNTASFPAAAARDADAATIFSATSMRKGSEVIVDPDIGVIVPIYQNPEETVEGQHGLVKHKLLNDRKRVLTLDTAGDVLLWDLLQCVPIQSFGKRHLEDVEPEVNTMEAIAPWCSLDTRTGRLAVVLEEYNCFDAEAYADELQLEETLEFRDDQRINLGKWVMRHLFSKFIDELIKRDEVFRKQLNEKTTTTASSRSNAPKSIQLPAAVLSEWQDGGGASSMTPRANGITFPMTPGMGIGVATPAAVPHLPGVPEDGAPLDKRASHNSRTSAERNGDYFSSAPLVSTPTAEINGKPAAAASMPSDVHDDNKPPKTPQDAEKGGKESTMFGRKFKMNMGMSFGTKKLGRSPSANAADKPVVVDEKSEGGGGSETSEAAEKEFDNNLLGVVQKIRSEYEKLVAENPGQLIESGITPSLPIETPVLKPPPMTTVIVQEETSGGSADLYRGTVETLGEDANLIELVAPMWLGDLLLKNKFPIKEPVKVSFILQPWHNLLPSIAGADGNSRLNANRMLRLKKILAYVSERIEAAPEKANPEALKPEEYLELYCYDQKLPNTMTLATLRAHIWKGGADVMLYYKSNGRKHIAYEKKTDDEEKPAQVAVPLAGTTTTASL